MVDEKHTQNQLNHGDSYTVGAVSYFNTRPLIYRLDQHPDIRLRLAPPARLARMLDQGAAHVALAPSIDYQRSDQSWTILPVAAIGTRGDVLSVRIFSQIPVAQIEKLYCDTESHTSVALVQVIWYLRFGRKLMLEPLTADPASMPSVLLIGDKVIPQLNLWPYEFDLGRAWCDLTGLPFVFAFWAAPTGLQLDPLLDILRHAYRQGLDHIDQIIDQYAAQHGFNPDLAQKYLTEHLFFDFAEPQMLSLLKFYHLAYQLNLIPHCRPLTIYPEPARIKS